VPDARNNWADGFARQSASDFAVYQHLALQPGFPACHALHYLQMACEKLAKAYRFRDESMSIDDIQKSHVAISKEVEQIVMSPDFRKRYASKAAHLKEILRSSRLLSREIEKLAPTVDREATPANAEYPWFDGRMVKAPCDYTFQVLSQLNTPEGRNFLKVISTSINDFAAITGS
jgi:hypothetical protein